MFSKVFKVSGSTPPQMTSSTPPRSTFSPMKFKRFLDKVGLNSPSQQKQRVLSWEHRLDETDVYRYRRQYGVNLGEFLLVLSNGCVLKKTVLI